MVSLSTFILNNIVITPTRDALLGKNTRRFLFFLIERSSKNPHLARLTHFDAFADKCFTRKTQRFRNREISVSHLSGFFVFECALRITYDFRADRVVLLIRRLYVHVIFTQSLDKYVALLIHLYLNSLIYMTFRLLRFRISHGIVKSTKSYSVNEYIEMIICAILNINLCIDLDAFSFMQNLKVETIYITIYKHNELHKLF